jgi:hypothetical protein
MLVSRDNRAYTVVLHYSCVNCVPRLHALSRVGTKQFPVSSLSRLVLNRSQNGFLFHLFPVSDREVHREQSLKGLPTLCESFLRRLKAYLHLYGRALWQP